MLCENCGENNANVKYTQIINGVKKQMNLCENCSEKLGIGENFSFNMPMDLPSFFGEFLEEYNDNNLLTSFSKKEELKCDKCGMKYDEFVNKGKVGCANCYNVFSEKILPILKNIHGATTHVGRKGKILDSNMMDKIKEKSKQNKEINKKDDKLSTLKEDLKKAIKEERYEDAAKLRDEIKKLEEK